MKIFSCIIAGAGPSGLFCGSQIRAGQDILILEKNSSPGKKLLISGSGQCNVTHTGDLPEFLKAYFHAGKFLRPALSLFPPEKLKSFLKDSGVPVFERDDGKVFPASMKAEDVLNALLKACDRNSCILRFSESVLSVKKEKDLFHFITDSGEYLSRCAVISCGGSSFPGTGSDGSGYRILKELGQPVTETVPGLSPLFIRDWHLQQLSGTGIRNSEISVYRNNSRICSGRGDVLFTHRGISGPGILDLSRYVLAGDQVRFSLVPLKADDFNRTFTEKSRACGRKNLRTFIKGFGLTESLASAVLDEAGISPELSPSSVSKEQRRILTGLCCGMSFTVSEKAGFSAAMVTAGGADLDSVNPRTMESRIIPGLFITGETLDVDGKTGGYNIQAAFSTGFSAAAGITAFLKRK